MATIFEWDTAKAKRNERKHGIAFEDAKDVFVDDTRLDLYRGDEHGEPRWLTIGFVGAQCLAVAYTWKEGNEDDGEEEIIRIISARLATRSEHRRYESGA